MITYNVTIFFIHIFEALIAWRYFSSIFTLKYKKAPSMALVFLGHILLYFSFIYFHFMINAIFLSIIYFLICINLFNIGIKEGIFHSLLITIIMYGSELLPIGFFLVIFSETFSIFEYSIELIILSIMTKLLYFLIIEIIRNKFIIVNKNDKTNLNIKPAGYLWSFPFATFLIYLIMYYILISYDNSNYFKMFLSISAIVLLFSNALVYMEYQYNQNLLIDKAKNQIQLEKETKDKEFYQMLYQEQEKQKMLIHDIKKHMNILKSYAQDNSMDLIKNYLYEIENSALYTQTLKICDNNTLNIVLTHYKNLFAKNKIESSFTVVPQSLDFMKETDITSIISNLLENALEANMNLEEAFVTLSIITDRNRNLTIIKMINSCNCSSLKSNDKSFLTSKTDTISHGYGLKSIEKTVEEYAGFCDFYNEENTFHSFISFENKRINALH